MTAVTFKPAKRERVPLLLAVAGGTGSGKTYSALRLARGLADGKPFGGIDTENGRMNLYAEDFPELQVAQIEAPFRPDKYLDAITAAEKAGFGVVIVDSASHEWYGDGGCLDWQAELMRGQESRRFLSWQEPKQSHKRFVSKLLQLNAHVILCLRAEEKIEPVKVTKNGREVTEFVPKRTLPGGSLDGWIPISEKNLPYEMTASFLLMADAPGVPKPIKLPGMLHGFVPLEKPLDEAVGRALAVWALGPGKSVKTPADAPSATVTTAADTPGDEPEADDLLERPVSAEELSDEITRLASELLKLRPDAGEQIRVALEKRPQEWEKIDWLQKQLANLASKAAK